MKRVRLTLLSAICAAMFAASLLISAAPMRAQEGDQLSTDQLSADPLSTAKKKLRPLSNGHSAGRFRHRDSQGPG
jgi:hypothetical protein